ncbi:HNH endonuclease [Paludisphaera soli]|uniref:HNH endonuclease n=1 Tax=Paludisphaera soli TaxID=2712865 RepID=UPI0013ECE59C|nr:HNH endonuclease [Paludisphaera soli]
MNTSAAIAPARPAVARISPLGSPAGMPGDSETWRGVPAEPALQASDLGRFRRARDCRILRRRLDTSGYRQVTCGHRTILSHRLVAEAVHGPAPTGRPEVDHFDGVKTADAPSKLEWVSHC